MTETQDTPPPSSKADNGGARPTPLGIYDKPGAGGVTEIEIIAVALSATTCVCATALGIASPQTHGTFAWTTPPIYAWSLITTMGLVGLATDSRGEEKPSCPFLKRKGS